MSLIDAIWGLAGFIEEIAWGIWYVLTALYGIFATIYAIMSDFLGLFPFQIKVILLFAILAASFYYIYHWLKDVSIAGFKI